MKIVHLKDYSTKMDNYLMKTKQNICLNHNPSFHQPPLAHPPAVTGSEGVWRHVPGSQSAAGSQRSGASQYHSIIRSAHGRPETRRKRRQGEEEEKDKEEEEDRGLDSTSIREGRDC